MANNYRVCICCNKRFKYCPHCSEYESLPTWYNLFHNENCHDIWYVLSDFESGFLTKEEAQEKISHLDTSVITNKEALKSLDKLMGTNHSVESESPKAEQPKVEEKPVITVDPFTRPAVPLSKAVEPTPVPAKEEKLSVSEELKKHDSAKAKSKKK